MAFNPWEQYNQSMGNLGQTVTTLRNQDMAEQNMARQNALAELQMKQANMTMDDTVAKQRGLLTAMGVDTPEAAYAAQFKAEQNKLAQEQAAAKMKTAFEGFKHFESAVKDNTMQPEVASAAYNAMMKFNGIDLDAIGAKTTFSNNGGFYSGRVSPETLFMINGVPTPYGSAGIIENATVVGSDPKTGMPIFGMSKETKFKEPQKAEETWGESYDDTVGGKKVRLQKSSTGQIRAIVSDTSTTVKVDTGKSGRAEFKDVMALRKEFSSLPEVKDYSVIQAQGLRAKKALEESLTKRSNMPVDQTVITTFNKLLDPTSVVRESEYARTPQDLALLSRLKGKWDKIQKGGAGLDLSERQAILRMITNFSEIADKQYNDQVEQYTKIAERNGFNPSDVIRLGHKQEKPPKGGNAPAASGTLKKSGKGFVYNP